MTQATFTKEKLNQFFATQLGAWVTVYSILLVSLPVAFLTPDDILEYELIGRYVRFMLNLVPMIYRMQALSPIPEIAKFYFAVMWTIMPIWIYLSFKIPDEIILPFEKAKQRKTFLAITYVSVLPLAMLWAFTFPSDHPSRIYQSMIDSRFGLGVMGVHAPLMIPAGIRLFVAWYRYFPRLYP